MTYKVSAKSRRFKRTVLKTIGILRLKGFNITTSLKVVVVGVVISSVGLFFNWFDTYEGIITGNGFHRLLGITGYILFLFNIKILFLIFGQKTKEFLKNLFHFFVRDGVLIFILSFFSLLLVVNSVFIIENTSIFKEGIILGKGIIIVIVGYVLSVVGAGTNLFVRTKTSVYLEKSKGENELIKEENLDNMKLPF